MRIDHARPTAPEKTYWRRHMLLMLLLPQFAGSVRVLHWVHLRLT